MTGRFTIGMFTRFFTAPNGTRPLGDSIFVRLSSFLPVIALALGLTAPGHAQPADPNTTGRVNGTVLERGKDPVAFANVVVLGTKQGAMTDENGKFVIAGVPVGTHQIRVQALGYEATTVEVQVNAGQIATVTVSVGATKITKELEEIEVKAEKPHRHQVVDAPSSRSSAEKLKELPVDNLSQAVATKAGVVAQGDDLHFRGGRGGEVKFQIDGIEASDPLLGRNANVANLAIAGAEVLSGGFDAEFGNALSGVISVSTKEGTDRFGGEVRWDTDRYGDPTKTFNNYDRFTFGFGGPTPIRNLTYFATYEGTFTDTYLASSLTKPSQHAASTSSPLGNRQSNQVNTNFKLAYRPESAGTSSRSRRSTTAPIDHALQPHVEPRGLREGDLRHRAHGRTAGQLPAALRNLVGDPGGQHLPAGQHAGPRADHRRHATGSSPASGPTRSRARSVMTTRLSALQLPDAALDRAQAALGVSNPESVLLDRQHRARHREQPLLRDPRGLPELLERDAQTWTVKSDFSTRNWKQHTVKTGLEARYNRVENLTLTAAEHRDQRPAGRQPLRLRELQPRGRGVRPGPLGVRGSGAERRRALRLLHARRSDCRRGPGRAASATSSSSARGSESRIRSRTRTC